MPYLRATIQSAGGADVMNRLGNSTSPRWESVKAMSETARFWIAFCVAVLPQLLFISIASQELSAFVLLVLLWNVAPMVTSAVLFVAGAHSAAWGWLIAAALWGLF